MQLLAGRYHKHSDKIMAKHIHRIAPTVQEPRYDSDALVKQLKKIKPGDFFQIKFPAECISKLLEDRMD